MKSPLISVIMPLYNKKPYVRRAIESIKQQTFTDWELIIVDDGSTDGSSVEIPQDDSRILLFHQKNKGPGAARNKGIRKASGSFITFIDADDYYYPQKLEVEINLLSKNKAQWMISPFWSDKNNQKKILYVKDINGKEIRSQPLVVDDPLNRLQLQGIHVDGLCVEKDLLEHLGGFNEDMRCYEITELVIRCALIEPNIFIYHQPLYHVSDVPHSAFKDSSHRTEGLRQMGEILYKLSKEYTDYSNFLSNKSRRSLYSYIAILILSGKGTEARRYLNYKFPYKRDKRWWKMWIGSWLPTWLLYHLVHTNNSFL